MYANIFFFTFRTQIVQKKYWNHTKNSTLRFWHIIYSFWGLLNSLMLFLRSCMHVCEYVCACVCEWTLNGAFDKVQIWYVRCRSPSVEPHWFLWIPDEQFFFQDYKNWFLFMQPTESNSLNCSKRCIRPNSNLICIL